MPRAKEKIQARVTRPNQMTQSHEKANASRRRARAHAPTHGHRDLRSRTFPQASPIRARARAHTHTRKRRFPSRALDAASCPRRGLRRFSLVSTALYPLASALVRFDPDSPQNSSISKLNPSAPHPVLQGALLLEIPISRVVSAFRVGLNGGGGDSSVQQQLNPPGSGIRRSWSRGRVCRIHHFLEILDLHELINKSIPWFLMEASSCLCYRVCGFGSPRIWLCVLLVLVLQNCSLALSASPYLVGMGSYDITGPAADVNMMGYANAEQIASGIHFRLKSRAFIVAEPNGKRVVFVNLDACMASQLVTIKVLERLKARYGDLYNESNLAISGIHTHAGPGGYLQYVVYIVTSLGFVRQSFDVIVDGIEQSIVEAHNNLRPGKIFVNKGDLLDAGVNRSPSAYLNNPADERSKYQYNVDKEMTLVKFVDDQLGPVGSFNWFATHGTSMSRTNSFISDDNKGAAARFMEDWAEQNDIPKQAAHANSDDLGSLHKTSGLPRRVSTIIPEPNEITDDLIQLASSYEASGGRRLAGSSITRRIRSTQENKAKFVSAFCQSNCGDVSPNVLGTFCIDTHLPCDFNHSTCNGKNELCYGRGPGYPDEFESTRIIGNRQFLKAVDLFNSASEEIQGKIDYRHTYLDFSQLEVSVSTSTGDQQVVKTCPAAMGFAFAAGTTDGPGAFDFKQGDVKGNPFWKLVRNLLKPPGKEQVECQAPKPILLDTGEMKEPYDWAPAILPIQIIRIGQLVILCVPGEFTTMAGRQLRDAVKNVLTSGSNGEFNNNIHVVLAGLTNTYSQYVTTFEEYQIQRYEGASTLYGPHTLSAYIQEFQKLATAMVENKEVPTNFQPPDLLDKQIGLLPGVMFDSTPIGVKFGDVSSDVPANSTFNKGSTVSATFYSACPRNDLLTDGTFSLVEKLDGSNWIPVYDDDDWSLRFKWSRPARLSPRSFATLEWTIPEDAASGVYRLRHFGASKPLIGSIKHFTGTSRAFAVR